MGFVWRWWALVAAVWATGAYGVEVPVIENAGYALCAREAKDASTVGRLILVFKETRAQIEASPDISPFARRLANDFFRAQEAGKFPSYIHFAQDRFKSCLRDQKVNLEVTDLQMFVCLTRIDIPFYFYMMKQAGVPVPEAVAKVEQGLQGWHYPPGLVAKLAEPAMAARDINDVEKLQFFLLNTCLLPAAEVRGYYGVPDTVEPATGE
ncbi:MAG: hypothetical protein K0Q68_2959 [Moraxellaceae bacterium]|nr:hypothetical protein [Moraxellaceae bacterium]